MSLLAQPPNCSGRPWTPASSRGVESGRSAWVRRRTRRISSRSLGLLEKLPLKGLMGSPGREPLQPGGLEPRRVLLPLQPPRSSPAAREHWAHLAPGLRGRPSAVIALFPHEAQREGRNSLIVRSPFPARKATAGLFPPLPLRRWAQRSCFPRPGRASLGSCLRGGPGVGEEGSK